MNLFLFEFTLVPPLNPATENEDFAAWFILSVQVDSMKEIFKNSLTGIFQFKYNNKNTSDLEYFKAIKLDCFKYIELFYYEKIFSQFAFLSNSNSKLICSFQKSLQGDWFKISPWFMEDQQSITISFSNESKFRVESCCLDINININLKEDLIVPSLSFNESEAKNIFNQLFQIIFMTKIKSFLSNNKENGLILDFIVKEKEHSITIDLFESFKLKISINPFSKKFKINFLENQKNSCSSFLSLDHHHHHHHFEGEIENCLINFDYEKFSEIISEIKKEIFSFIINRNNLDLGVSIVNCSDISSSSKTGICLQVREFPSSAFSINLNPKNGEIEVKLWTISINFQNGFMDIKFEEIEILTEKGKEDENEILSIPRNSKELFDLIKSQGKILLKVSFKFSFKTIIKNNGIEGKFEDSNSFRIFSFGLPTCIEKVLLISDFETVNGQVFYNFNNFKKLIKIGKSENNNLNLLLLSIKNTLKLFSIMEHFNTLFQDEDEVEGENGMEMEFISYEPIKLKFKNNTFLGINSKGELNIFINNERINSLEEILNSESFSIYEFVDELLEMESKQYNNNNNNNLKNTEKSPDLTWLSDSFM